MKITNLDERVHVLDNHTNVWSVVRDIANSGVQEEAFYVCDIGEIVQKHNIWKQAMPRVEPHYGKNLISIIYFLAFFPISPHEIYTYVPNPRRTDDIDINARVPLVVTLIFNIEALAIFI